MHVSIQALFFFFSIFPFGIYYYLALNCSFSYHLQSAIKLTVKKIIFLFFLWINNATFFFFSLIHFEFIFVYGVRECSFFCLLSFIFCLFRAALTTYGGSQAWGLIGATAVGLHHSHGHTGSEPHLRPTPQLMAMPDQTLNLTVPSRICLHCTIMGTPILFFSS